MKLQLLLVLAVAALVPSLSEGRVFSKCELKTIFQTSFTLTGKLQKHKQELLAAIICQLNATSGLNSNLVTVTGIRTTTTAQPSILLPTGNPTVPVNQTINPPTNTTETTVTPNTTTSTTTAPTTSTPTNVTADATTAGLASPSPSTLPGVKRRRRRSNSRKNEKKGKQSKLSEKSVFDLEMECDMQEVQQDDNGKRQSSESSEEDQHKTVWSLGKYGLFQLTDSHFCDSGYRWSRNVCHRDCSAFTDDDITDDIECFLDSGYLGCFLEMIPQFCLDQAKTYFNDCS